MFLLFSLYFSSLNLKYLKLTKIELTLFAMKIFKCTLVLSSYSCINGVSNLHCVIFLEWSTPPDKLCFFDGPLISIAYFFKNMFFFFLYTKCAFSLLLLSKLCPIPLFCIICTYQSFCFSHALKITSLLFCNVCFVFCGIYRWKLKLVYSVHFFSSVYIT